MLIRRFILIVIGLATACIGSALLIFNIRLCIRATVLPTESEPKETVAIEITMPSADISLPYEVSGTDLQVEQLVQYEGAYMEDGTYDEVVNVAALMVRNLGDTVIADASVILQRGDLELSFEISFLPPGKRVLVLEKGRKCCLPGNFTNCSVQVRHRLPMADNEQITVLTTDDDTLYVKNGMQRPASIYVYYKTVYGYGSCYIGGIAHSVKLEYLEPGESVMLHPEYYSSVGSEVVYILVA